jgi:Ca2+-binding EF-hand superfamily protein
LLFAGIPTVFMMNQKADSINTLKREEFFSVGRHSVMSNFSKQQVANISKVFEEFDEDNSHELEREELDFVFRQVFQPNMNIQEIDGMSHFWDNDGNGTVDREEFWMIASRFVKQHEVDWILLKALQAILGSKDDVTELSTRLTVDDLIQNSQLSLTKEDAEEMLWACDWRNANEEGETDIAPPIMDVVAALVVDAMPQKQMLPPEAIQVVSQDRTKPGKPISATVSGPTGTPIGKSSLDRQISISSVPEERATTMKKNAKGLVSHLDNICADPPSTAAHDVSRGYSFSRGVTPISPKSLKSGSNFARLASPFSPKTSDRRRPEKAFSREVTPMSPRGSHKAPLSFPRQTSPFSPAASHLGGRAARQHSRQISHGSHHGTAKGQSAIAALESMKQHVGEIMQHQNESHGDGIQVDEAAIAQYVSDLRYESVRDDVLSMAKERALLANAEASNTIEEDESVDDEGEEAPLSPRFKKPYHQRDSDVDADTYAKWKRLHHLLHEPEGSKIARAWSALILGTVVLSLVALLFEPVLNHMPKHDTQLYMYPLEIYFTVIFTFELSLRYVVARMAGAHTSKSFLLDTRNICDIIAITPFFFEMLLKMQEDEMKLLRMNRLTRLTRLVRILRVARVARLGAMNAVMGAVCTVFAVIWGIYLKNQGYAK